MTTKERLNESFKYSYLEPYIERIVEAVNYTGSNDHEDVISILIEVVKLKKQKTFVKSDWEEEFREKFKCIQGCDGNGSISHQVGDGEYEEEQCQFHAEYLFPIKSFIKKVEEKAKVEGFKNGWIKHALKIKIEKEHGQ